MNVLPSVSSETSLSDFTDINQLNQHTLLRVTAVIILVGSLTFTMRYFAHCITVVRAFRSLKQFFLEDSDGLNVVLQQHLNGLNPARVSF